MYSTLETSFFKILFHHIQYYVFHQSNQHDTAPPFPGPLPVRSIACSAVQTTHLSIMPLKSLTSIYSGLLLLIWWLVCILYTMEYITVTCTLSFVAWTWSSETLPSFWEGLDYQKLRDRPQKQTHNRETSVACSCLLSNMGSASFPFDPPRLVISSRCLGTTLMQQQLVEMEQRYLRANDVSQRTCGPFSMMDSPFILIGENFLLSPTLPKQSGFILENCIFCHM